MAMLVHRRTRRSICSYGVRARWRMVMPVLVRRSSAVPVDVKMALGRTLAAERRIERVARPSRLLMSVAIVVMIVIMRMMVVTIMPGIAHLPPGTVSDP